MHDHIKSNETKLFIQLSEQEQETVSGGCSNNLPFGMFLYQQRDILSYANSETKFSTNDGQFSHNQTSLYSLSETTFLFSPLFGGGGGRRRNRSRKGNSFLASIFNLF
jgi:hypothetical protein